MDERVAELRDEIIHGVHDVSIDAIVETEFFAVRSISVDHDLIYDALLAIGRLLPLTSEVCRVAGSWLAPMDEAMRRAHFADALIAAGAHSNGAMLVTGDRRIGRVFPVRVLEY